MSSCRISPRCHNRGWNRRAFGCSLRLRVTIRGRARRWSVWPRPPAALRAIPPRANCVAIAPEALTGRQLPRESVRALPDQVAGLSRETIASSPHLHVATLSRLQNANGVDARCSTRTHFAEYGAHHPWPCTLISRAHPTRFPSRIRAGFLLTRIFERPPMRSCFLRWSPGFERKSAHGATLATQAHPIPHAPC